jgi:hypothetical protein
MPETRVDAGITMSNLIDENQIEQEEIDSTYEESASEKVDEPIKEPFDPKKIEIITKPSSVDLLCKRLKKNEINLYTHFQREGNLWDNKKQSQLIESMLIRLPLPAFYFDASNDNSWLVVDGLQRLYSIKNFIVDKKMKLSDLQYLKQFDGCTFIDLPRELQRRIEETQIIVFLISSGTPPNVKFNLFQRLNTGGLVLTPQEIRHALNQGIPADFIKELAELDEFKTATHGLLQPKRMEDRDFVTRALAFMTQSYTEYSPDLDEYLFKQMAKIGEKSEKERIKLKSDFINSLKTCYEIMKEFAFRRRTLDVPIKKNKINKALFEVWISEISILDKDSQTKLIAQKDNLNNKFMKLNTDPFFIKSITSGTGKKSTVVNRHQKIREIIQEVLL